MGEAFWSDVIGMWQSRPRLDSDDLRSINAPVLLIRGQFDDITESHANEMVSHIPGAKLVTIPGVGHRLLLQAPQSVTGHILSFLLAPKIDTDNKG